MESRGSSCAAGSMRGSNPASFALKTLAPSVYIPANELEDTMPRKPKPKKVAKKTGEFEKVKTDEKHFKRSDEKY